MTYYSPQTPEMPTAGTFARMPTAPDPSHAGSSEYTSGHAEIRIPSFSPEDALATVYTSQYFKWHVYTAIALAAGSFIGWLVQSFIEPTWPWFLFVFGALTLSLSTHFYLVERPHKELLQLHFMFFAVVNTLTFFSWVFAHNWSHSWFIEVFFGTAWLLSIHYLLHTLKNSPNKWLYIHMASFALGNLFLFTVWLDAGKGTPWFLYPLFITALLLNIHWQLDHKVGDYLFKIHLGTFAFINMALFFSWAIFTMAFPWFVFPLIVWGIVLGIHHGYGGHLTYFAPSKQEAQSPTTLPGSSAGAN